jgi:hypothetical protein
MRLAPNHHMIQTLPANRSDPMGAWRASKRIFDPHPPDQRAQLRVDPQSPPNGRRPVAAKADPVPAHESLRPDDCENPQD